MSERRQAFRRESIEVDLGDDRIIRVDPIPWETRNDFGNEVMRQYVEILNESVRQYIDPDTQAPQLEATLAERFNDPQALFRLGLSEEMLKVANSKGLFENQVLEILLAIIDINNLKTLRPLIDPNSNAPTTLGGMLEELTLAGIATPKTVSGPDSLSPDSTETPSEVSQPVSSTSS